MSPLNKLERIGAWYDQVFSGDVAVFKAQESPDCIREVEHLSGETFPPEIRELYQNYDGEVPAQRGRILGHSLVSLDWMKKYLREAVEAIKPKNPSIPDVAQADRYVNEIVEVVTKSIDRPPFENAKYGWHWLDFECGPASMGGPYLYASAYTTGRDREILKLSGEAKDEIWRLARLFNRMEKEAFGWDFLKFRISGHGAIDLERCYHDTGAEFLSSLPEGAIRIKDFHNKWLPVIHDGGNNCIGIDLDPADRGTRGQVIVFGRDEDERFVVSRSWECFLDHLLQLIEDEGQAFREERHLHDYLKSELFAR
ncbi:SMI1 / KNR4 family protein [Phaeobacter sp. CECT 5382]|uniref:SMI1/KNR4 family protein n=1 Tax=Phaeobacter sp. CECT 5382 TaxID=1712645 RepID=UPI0006D9C043|nr:SMI1/KNR4 family protein [Phaeobacter sp. CECT 5382]CUH88528.1 SMI1 / KNR4 family protein [Phaeobacter sp. CECT 5382]